MHTAIYYTLTGPSVCGKAEQRRQLRGTYYLSVELQPPRPLRGHPSLGRRGDISFLPSSHEGEAGIRKGPLDLFPAERVRATRTPGGMCPRRGRGGVVSPPTRAPASRAQSPPATAATRAKSPGRTEPRSNRFALAAMRVKPAASVIGGSVSPFWARWKRTGLTRATT